MKAEITKIHTLSGPTSPSAIDFFDGRFFVIGDDATSLFIYEANTLHLVNTMQLFESKAFRRKRIPKFEKPDLEASCIYHSLLFLFGSGSLPQRERGFTISLSDGIVQEFSLAPFYKCLRNEVALGVLNIEGAAVLGKVMHLFHRGNEGGSNLIFVFLVRDFLDWIEGGMMPDFATTTIILPPVADRFPTISGACEIPMTEELLLSASIEDAPNAILDGEVLGSTLAVWERGEIKAFSPIYENGVPTTRKVESVTVPTSALDGVLQIVGVVDDDQGGSTLLEISW